MTCKCIKEKIEGIRLLEQSFLREANLERKKYRNRLSRNNTAFYWRQLKLTNKFLGRNGRESGGIN